MRKGEHRIVRTPLSDMEGSPTMAPLPRLSSMARKEPEGGVSLLSLRTLHKVTRRTLVATLQQLPMELMGQPP